MSKNYPNQVMFQYLRYGRFFLFLRRRPHKK